MGASRSVQFHGARRQVNDTHIRPPSVTGAYAASSHGFSSGSDRPPHTDLAFATHTEHEAWSYARTYTHHQDAPLNNDPDPKHRGRVYEVEPAHDQYQSSPHSEIESETGYRIKRAHMSAPGDTSTFHEVNWNAYKRKPAPGSGTSFVPSGDANHSYMEVDPATKDKVPKPIPFREATDYQNRYAVDPRHPDQQNLFTGKTVAEHKVYEHTPGVMLHLNPEQFDSAAFHRDPTVSTIRASKPYHRVDTQFDTVR